MATKHGNRVYIQVLLEPFRGELFMQEANAQGIKPSALIRLRLSRTTHRRKSLLRSSSQRQAKVARRCRRQA
jgi:hypothetical protein